MSPDPAPVPGGSLDPADALRLLDDQERSVRRALDVRLHEQLAAWGVAWLVGLGLIWWQVRGQRPYAGPTALGGVVFGVLLVLAGAVTGWRTWQATSGIGGDAGWQGTIFGAAWGLGFLAHFGVIGALGRAGAGPEVIGILSVTGSLLIVGLMYLFGAASWGVRPMAALGGWLVLLASAVGFAGPVGATLLAALLGGGAFLLTAGWLWLGRRP